MSHPVRNSFVTGIILFHANLFVFIFHINETIQRYTKMTHSVFVAQQHNLIVNKDR